MPAAEIADETIARTEFTGLCDVLRLAETHGVVVPQPSSELGEQS
jgi:hypothetical protein